MKASIQEIAVEKTTFSVGGITCASCVANIEKALAKVESFEAITGKEIKGKVDGKEVLVGNRKLMIGSQIDFSQFKNKLGELEDEAKTAMIVTVDNKIAGIIAVADTLKEDSIQAHCCC